MSSLTTSVAIDTDILGQESQTRLYGHHTPGNQQEKMEHNVYSWHQLKSFWEEGIFVVPANIDVFRHGQTINNERNLISGASDVPLTDQGRITAREMGEQLNPPYDRIVCSNLSRSEESLLITLRSRQGPAVYHRDPRLAERSLGILEGTAAVHIPQFASGDLDFAPPSGESYRDLARRVMSLIADLSVAVTSIENPKILLSTHMGPMRVIHTLFSQISDARQMMALKFPNSNLISYKVERAQWPTFL